MGTKRAADVSSLTGARGSAGYAADVPDAFAELQNRLAEIHDIRTAAGLMQWDQEVMMPPGGAPTRAEQRATLERIAHQRFVDDEMGRLFDGAREIEESLPYDSDEASLVRVARRDWEKARRVPTDLAAEMTRVSSQAVEAWARARTESDFAAFKPWLQKTLDLKQRYIACFDPADEPYDVLLDDFEPGMKTATVRAVFDRLKTELVPLIAAARTTEDFAFMSGPFAEEDQHALSIELLEKMGMTPGAYRLDTTVHPFCSGTATQDIRLTTRYDVNSLASLFTAMHEGGHGLYEHGVSASLERTPLCSGCSAALHESQSRLWENVVGRSLPFWRWFFPRLQATFPGVLGLVELDDFHRAVNAVRPSFIRVDADEATYGCTSSCVSSSSWSSSPERCPSTICPTRGTAALRSTWVSTCRRIGSAAFRTFTGRSAPSDTSPRTRSAT